jgi:Fe-S oxidoreductase
MCPSYRASREEKYSTRGRARLLFEMLNGEVIEEGWQSEAVKDSLDHCLACKGCRSDCPTHVDIAKYKSHFLYEYHKHKRRHVMDALVSRIGNWLPVATHVSGAANALMRNPSFRKVSAKFGLAEDVKFPAIAAKTFRNGASAKRLLAQPESATRTPVLLWTDTFNNGFTPEVMEAAVRVLESKGFEVRLLSKHVCCGRPMYDAGLLDEAKRNLETILSEMANVIEAKLPVVVLEPSCLSVFRDELRALFPDDARAHALAKAVKTLAELLHEHGVTLPKLDEDVHVHGHCHQKACGGMKAETQLLQQATSKGSVLPTGCCGMAGAYGYHRKTADLAKKVAQSELVPVIDALQTDAVIVSDGFSCRSQIRNTTGRIALHLAQWLDREADEAKAEAAAEQPVASN